MGKYGNGIRTFLFPAEYLQYFVVVTRVADPKLLILDPDPTFQSITDPDQTFR